MTTAVPSATPHLSRMHYVAIAVAASVIQMLMMIPGYSEDGFEAGAWTIVLAISLVVGLLVFAFVVPRGGAVTGLVLGGLALVSVLVFWAGLTLPLAAAAAVVGWRVREGGEHTTKANVTLGLSALSAVLLVVTIIGDAIAN